MKRLKFLFLVLFVGFAISTQAQSSAELKRKKEAIQREIELLQKNLSKTANNKKLTLQQINALNAQIRARQDKISVINSEMKNLDNQITENTNTVHTLKGQLSDLKKEYAGMIRFAQRNKNAYDKMMFIFAAKDFNQAYKRIKYLQQFSQYRKKQAGYIETNTKQLNNKIVVLDKTLKEKSTLLKDQEKEKERLGKDKNEQAAVFNKYNKQEKKYKQDITQRNREKAQLDRSIRAAIQREIEIARRKAEEEAREAARIAAAKAKAENKPEPVAVARPKSTNAILSASPEAAKLSAGFENNRGRLPWPVAQVSSITERFGMHKVDQASYDNGGINILTADGAAVRTVFDGVVSTVFNQYGKYVVLIRHGEYFTVYQNLRSVSVSQGAKVSTKQTIGVVANSGDGSELHFEIIRGQTRQNPEAWLAR